MLPDSVLDLLFNGLVDCRHDCRDDRLVDRRNVTVLDAVFGNLVEDSLGGMLRCMLGIQYLYLDSHEFS